MNYGSESQPSHPREQNSASTSGLHPNIDRWVIHRFATDLAMTPTWSLRSRYAAQNIFPSAEYMQWRYDIDQRWMAPAYYPYRWWVGLTGVWKDHN